MLMRICIVTFGFPVRSETFIVEQVRALQEQGHEIVVLCDRAGDLIDIDSQHIVPTGVRTSLIPSSFLRVLVAAAHTNIVANRPKILQILRALSRPSNTGLGRLTLLGVAIRLAVHGPFDLILAHFGPNGERAAAAREMLSCSAPIATVFHGFDVSRRDVWFRSRRYPLLGRFGDLFLPVSEFWAERLAEAGLPRHRIVVQRMGIDLQKFRYRIPDSTKRPLRVLSVGRMVEKKGFDCGIRAISRLNSAGHDVVYRIAGDGPLRTRLESLSAQLSVNRCVEFIGWKSPSEVRYLMADADVLLVPSITAPDGDMEGLPVVIMEAMASGTLVVATRHSGIPELVDDGRSGWLAIEGDPASLADAIVRAINRRAEWPSIAAEARRRVEAQHDSRKLAAELMELVTRRFGTDSGQQSQKPGG